MQETEITRAPRRGEGRRRRGVSLHRHLVVAAVAGTYCAFATCAAEIGSNAVEDTSKMLSTAARDQSKTQGLFGRIALAYLANRGNTDTTNANAELDLGFLAGHWRHAGMVRGTIGSSAGIRTAEEYRGNLQSDYTFSDNNYVFGAIDGSYDRFGAYQRRTSSTIGLGRRFIDTPAQQLDIQAGIGVSRTRRPAEAAEQETIVAGTLKYGWKMSDHAAFTERIAVEARSSNTYSESVSAITAGLRGDLALSVSYTLRHNTNVPPDRLKNDTATAVSLIYGF